MEFVKVLFSTPAQLFIIRLAGGNELVGIPKEIKSNENRVALTPAGVLLGGVPSIPPGKILILGERGQRAVAELY